MDKRCSKCNAIDSLVVITSRAYDGNYIVYPNGRESSGYLPNVSGLCNSDGLLVMICIVCGQLDGLDLIALREAFTKTPDDEE